MMDSGYGMTDPGFGVERAGKATLVEFSPTTVYYVTRKLRAFMLLASSLLQCRLFKNSNGLFKPGSFTI